MRTLFVLEVYFNDSGRFPHSGFSNTAELLEALERINELIQETGIFAFPFFVIDQELGVVSNAHI